MTRLPLHLLLLSTLMLASSCHHPQPAADAEEPHYSHEEAQPMSALSEDEFSHASPRHGRRR